MKRTARQEAQHQADLFAGYPLTDYSTGERDEIAQTQAYDLCREPGHNAVIEHLAELSQSDESLSPLVEACHDELERLYRAATEGYDDGYEQAKEEAVRARRG